METVGPSPIRVPIAGRLGAVAAGVACLAVLGDAAEANWLTRTLQELGKAERGTASVETALLEKGAAHLRALPPPKGVAFAAHATAEGHWKFVNREGDVYTAGTPEELKRVAAILAPESAAGPDAPLVLYLTEDTVFDRRPLLETLPKASELHVLTRDGSYPLTRAPAHDRLYAEVRPNLLVELGARADFEEALWQLARPLERARMRVLALEPGAQEALTPQPRHDAHMRALVDAVDPALLPDAVSRLRGQTMLVTGRIMGERLHFLPARGPEQTLPIRDLVGAAESADANLIVLQSASPRQPGGRNWLWQRVEVAGLTEALERPTVADFLNALAGDRGRLVLTVPERGENRVVLRAARLGAPATEQTGGLAQWFGEALSNITGNVVTNAVEAHVRTAERQKELDSRIVPGVPSGLQFAYLGGMLLGLLSFGVVRQWWKRLWPVENRAEYASDVGYQAARATRLAVLLLVFLPLAGLPAFLAAAAVQVWHLAMAPYRFVHWLLARLRPKAG